MLKPLSEKEMDARMDLAEQLEDLLATDELLPVECVDKYNALTERYLDTEAN